ncbi:MAG: pimeloyl-CoA dehydrogenase small subunit [Gammaproteobacteria bacterium]|nr:MAG: pimeloyl-CoA dehydrogenase small subunit [Gammaproteobacteria bacterium]
MDFSISEEQSMLADSVSKFMENDYDFERRQEIAETDDGYSKELWHTFAELGWTAVPFAEDDGGLGGGPVELMLMMEQFGRGLVVEPYLANVVLAGGILRRSANAGQKSQWLTPLIEGNLQAALAFAEPQGRFNIADIKTTAQRDGKGFILSGNKILILNGGGAEILIIPARTSGEQTDEDGITLFAIAADSAGIKRQAYATVDAQQAADMTLSNVKADATAVLGEIGQGFSTLQDVVDEATLAVCAEAVGIMRTMHDKTVEYSKIRVQFGVPIGSFQALQHRMVETLMACEQSRSLLMWAVMLDTADNADTQRAVSAIKYQIGTAGINVAREAVQIHGGMGMTWELDIAHYFKRMTAIDLLFGNADYHLDRYIRLSP